eukprot:scaffold128398_cov84-Phaeocystis_antarctica.AAC.2
MVDVVHLRLSTKSSGPASGSSRGSLCSAGSSGSSRGASSSPGPVAPLAPLLLDERLGLGSGVRVRWVRAR